MTDRPTLPTVRPAYVGAFECIAGDCPDSCCIGLDVSLTQPELVRLRKAGEDMSLHAPFDELVVPVQKPTEKEAAVITRPNGRCAFLREDNLCVVIAAHGQAPLGQICRQYPRQTNDVGGRVEVGATLGCPEIARLVLALDAPFALEQVAHGPDARHDKKVGADSLAHRDRVMAVLTDETRPVRERLLAMLWPDGAPAGIVCNDMATRARVGRDLLVARVMHAQSALFTEPVLRLVFATQPTLDEVRGFFDQDPPPKSARGLDEIEARLAAASPGEDPIWERAYTRYAAWRIYTHVPARYEAFDFAVQVLAELCAVRLLALETGDVTLAVQQVARQFVHSPGFMSLIGPYLIERELLDERAARLVP